MAEETISRKPDPVYREAVQKLVRGSSGVNAQWDKAAGKYIWWNAKTGQRFPDAQQNSYEDQAKRYMKKIQMRMSQAATAD